MNFLRNHATRIALSGILLLSAFGVAGAATITIVNNNAAGVGFNDPTVVAPVGGNPGTTLGQQRLNVFTQAASIWGSILPSAVTILVRSQFAAQTCTATSAVLGSAGPTTVHANFTGAIMPNYWYYQSLANRLNGTDLSAANPDINATFNSNIDAGCFGPGFVWYYGYDGLESPTQIELLPVVLHEMGHGLGFSTQTSGTTGNYLGSPSGFPTIFDHFLYDDVAGLHWDQMTPAQRVASAINTGHLTWDGPSGVLGAQGYLGPRAVLKVNSPGVIAGTYTVQTASFGSAITLGGVTGNVVLAVDGVAPVNDGCEPLVNAGAIAGNFALIDRGLCTFVVKAQQAQAAGAIGLIVANNAAGLPGMGGTDPSITIPCIGISQADGNAIKAQLGGGVNVTVKLDPTLLSGATNAGLPLMYAPNPFASGSSVSHWDVSMTPNTLMEPAINNDLHNTVDLTVNVFQDIGWFGEPTATTLARFDAQGRTDGILVRWMFTDPTGVATVTLERSTEENGVFAGISSEIGQESGMTTALDASAEAGKTYFYRLSITDREGNLQKIGLASALRPSGLSAGLELSAPRPNPTSAGASMSFRLGQPEYVRLSVIDASGRTVRAIHEGMMLAGSHDASWDGRSDRSGDVPAGIYFVRLQTSQGVKLQRLAVMR
jgi:hypothetical protein